jgi:hypothetical protein
LELNGTLLFFFGLFLTKVSSLKYLPGPNFSSFFLGNLSAMLPKNWKFCGSSGILKEEFNS